MAEPHEKDSQPTTLPELEEQLDKDEPLKIVDHTTADEPELVGPRERGPNPSRTPLPEPEQISDDVLEQAASATEEADDEEGEESQPPLRSQSLHLEANPNAPRPYFWKRKKFWFTAIFIVLVSLTLAWLIRPSRFFILNTLGLRAAISITTTTQSAAGQQSAVLKNVAIDLNGTQLQTDDTGRVTANVTYGDITITTKKAGYEQIIKTAVVDFDPFFHVLGGRQWEESERRIVLQIKSVGLSLKLQAKDWLTESPLTVGSFSVGDVVAKPDDKGVVSFTLPATDAKSVKVKATFNGSFIDKEFELPLDNTRQTVNFVPAGKHYFVSNRDGGLAVYSSNLDGSDVAVVVSASAQETAAMNIAISPSGKFGLLASTRGGVRDAQGTLLQQLYLVDLATKKMNPVDVAQWFNFADWSGDTLVYTAGERLAGASGLTQRLASVDVVTGKRTQLGIAGSYGTVRVGVDSVMYQAIYLASDPNYANSPDLRVTSVKGGTEKSLGYKIQQLAQLENDRFAYQTSSGAWQEYNLNTSQPKSGSAPAKPDRVIMATPTADGQNRLVLDKVDGKPTLLLKSVANGQEKQLHSAVGIRGPIRLVGDTVVFRMNDGAQSSDYVLSLNGGAPKKIIDVTAPLNAFTVPAGYLGFF